MGLYVQEGNKITKTTNFYEIEEGFIVEQGIIVDGKKQSNGVVREPISLSLNKLLAFTPDDAMTIRTLWRNPYVKQV